jgi:hypothetical protein
MNTIKEKTLCLKFLGIAKSGAMANTTAKVEIKISHLKSKTLNIQVLVTKQ